MVSRSYVIDNLFCHCAIKHMFKCLAMYVFGLHLNYSKYEYLNVILNLSTTPIYVNYIKITVFILVSMELHGDNFPGI